LFFIRFCNIGRAVFKIGKNNSFNFIGIYRNTFSSDFIPWSYNRDNISVRVVFSLINIVDSVYFFGNFRIDFNDYFLAKAAKVTEFPTEVVGTMLPSLSI
jgi:hypothetical protein